MSEGQGGHFTGQRIQVASTLGERFPGSPVVMEVQMKLKPSNK